MIGKKTKKWFIFTMFVYVILVLLPIKMSAEGFPEIFDPRESSTPPFVKSQTRGICWAYATVAAMEQNYLNETGIQMKLSENYYNYLLAANMTGTSDYRQDVNGWLDSGYAAFPVLEQAMIWKGPVLETSFPNSIKGFQKLELLDNRPAALHVQGFSTLPKMENFKTNTVDEISQRVIQIKELVQKHGNVITSRNGLGSYRTDYHTQNLLPDRVTPVEVNHVVTIVGWIDQFDKSKFTYQPARNGAFIAKNSWGTEWGENGYYYISYEDAFLRGEDLHSITSVEANDNYKTRYGNAKRVGGGQRQTENSQLLAHAFDVPKQEEKIEAVSIRTQYENVGYEIYVKPTGIPTKGLEGFIKVAEGVKTDIGAETIKLKQAIPITSTDQFSVAVNYIKPANLRSILLPTDTGVSGWKNDFRGYCLTSDNSTWRKENADYLFNVYTNNVDPNAPNEELPIPAPIDPEESSTIGIIDELFPDSVFAKEIARLLEKTVSDKFTEEDAESIVAINLYNRQIATAQGVEYLVNLKKLDFRGGKLKDINLAQNKKLQYLQIDRNQLTHLDVSNHPDLYWLEAGENPLTSIDLSGCPKLKTLSLNNSRLTSVDLSSNTQLSSLNIYWNALQSIDVSHNPNLERIDVASNQLKSINVTQNPKLISLGISSNSAISTLDITRNSELVELETLFMNLTELDTSQNFKLERMIISYNNISKLDVSQNTELVKLYATNNKLQSLDLSNNLKLDNLNVSNNQLQILDLSKNLALKNGFYGASNNPGMILTPPTN